MRQGARLSRRNADHLKAYASGAAPLRGSTSVGSSMSSLNISLVEERRKRKRRRKRRVERGRFTYPPGTTPPPRDYPASFSLLPFLGDNGLARDDRWALRCEADFMAQSRAKFRAEKEHAILCNYFIILLRVKLSHINYSASKRLTS